MGTEWQGLKFQALQSVFPALTCTAQASFRTATSPARHGMIANGLFHPNCRHTVSLWVEGLSTKPEPVASDPERYEAEQSQRSMERTLRGWKLRQSAAIDDAARQRADAKVREWQGRIREHVAANNLTRQYGRERAGRAR